MESGKARRGCVRIRSRREGGRPFASKGIVPTHPRRTLIGRVSFPRTFVVERSSLDGRRWTVVVPVRTIPFRIDGSDDSWTSEEIPIAVAGSVPTDSASDFAARRRRRLRRGLRTSDVLDFLFSGGLPRIRQRFIAVRNVDGFFETTRIRSGGDDAPDRTGIGSRSDVGCTPVRRSNPCSLSRSLLSSSVATVIEVRNERFLAENAK